MRPPTGLDEFYAERARITRRLIEECGFTAVAIEGDWPDAYRVNRYVLGESPDPDANTALASFQRFPTWMWRNREVLTFVEWLRTHNDRVDASTSKVRFYGLDLYSLAASMEAVVALLGNRGSRRGAAGARSDTPASIGSARAKGKRTDTPSHTEARCRARTKSSHN